MAALRQVSNATLGCAAAPQVVKAGDSTVRRVNMASLESAMAGLQLKGMRTGPNVVERAKRTSVVSQAVSTEKELELNIADDVTQVLDCAPKF